MLSHNLKKNYFWFSREWPYKNIKRKIFVEEYIETEGIFKDYKVYCFNGRPGFCAVISKEKGEKRLSYYDLQWEKIPVKHRYENHTVLEKTNIF